MYLIFLLGAMGCNLKQNLSTKFEKQKDGADSTRSFSNPYDSLAKVIVDTSTLEGKRELIMNNFLIENTPSGADYDSLIDLNYDGYKDYIIGYYGKAGSGIKNRIKVYLYIPQKHFYLLDEQLSNLPNPTFYINKKKVTSFYLSNGGGSGHRLEWIKNKWIITKEFYVSNEKDSSVWQISYPLKKKKEVFISSYQMIPPYNILETVIKI